LTSSHKLLPVDSEGVERGDIVLKYYHALSNGLFVWAGMTSMVELNALWDEMAEVMRKEGRKLTLGVFLPGKNRLHTMNA